MPLQGTYFCFSRPYKVFTRPFNDLSKASKSGGSKSGGYSQGPGYSGIHVLFVFVL